MRRIVSTVLGAETLHSKEVVDGVRNKSFQVFTYQQAINHAFGMVGVHRLLPVILIVVGLFPITSGRPLTFKDLNPTGSSPNNTFRVINLRKSADRNSNRNFPGDMVDGIGIVIDVVYRLNQTLLYGASVLRTIKWIFFIFKFIG